MPKKNQVTTHVHEFFSDLFLSYFNTEHSLGRLLKLNLAWDQLSRSILAAFFFWLEFRKFIFMKFSHFLKFFNVYIEIDV